MGPNSGRARWLVSGRARNLGERRSAPGPSSGRRRHVGVLPGPGRASRLHAADRPGSSGWPDLLLELPEARDGTPLPPAVPSARPPHPAERPSARTPSAPTTTGSRLPGMNFIRTATYVHAGAGRPRGMRLDQPRRHVRAVPHGRADLTTPGQSGGGTERTKSDRCARVVAGGRPEGDAGAAIGDASGFAGRPSCTATTTTWWSTSGGVARIQPGLTGDGDAGVARSATAWSTRGRGESGVVHRL